MTTLRSGLPPSLLGLVLLGACGGGEDAGGAPAAVVASPGDVRRVVLDAGQQQRLAIATAVAGPRLLERHIALPASVQASPHRTVHLTSRVPGVITDLHVQLGVAVTKGMPLLELDSVLIGEAARDHLRAVEVLQAARTTLEEETRLLDRQLEQERGVLDRTIAVAQQIFDREAELKQQELSTVRPYLEAQRQLEQARLGRESRLTELEIQRERRLLQLQVALRQATIEEHATHNKLHSLGVGDARIDALAETEPVRLGSYTVVAPMDGVLVRAHVALDEYVGEEHVLFEIQDLARVWIVADVFEKDLTRIRVGNTLQVELQAHGDRRFAGKVDYLDYVIDQETRTARIRAELDNAPLDGWPEPFPLRPGMFGTARVSTGARDVAVMVPRTAIVHEGERTFVFVREAADTWVRQPVRVQPGDDEHVEVLGGLRAGAVVAVSEVFTLKSLARAGEIGEGEG